MKEAGTPLPNPAPNPLEIVVGDTAVDRQRAADEHWMRQALALAELGRGRVEPNPMVGAVLVRQGVQIASGYHEQFGGPHAEVHALRQAGPYTYGSTLYVTLEPCCHFGKTPPCTDAIIRAGVDRVVVALRDPFPAVAGKGIAQLEQAGICVESNVLAAEAMRLNAAFLKRTVWQQPYVHAKWAMTLDGRIATAGGESKWISNEASRQHAHQFRGLVDAIVVGIGTALADDPLLTARPPGPRTALRIVLDAYARLPQTSRLVQTATTAPVLIACTSAASADRRRQLQAAGCEILLCDPPDDQANELPAAPESPRPKLIHWNTLLNHLYDRQVTHVLVEGGSEVHGSLLQERAIDAVRIYVAPILVGGVAAKGPIAGPGWHRLQDRLTLENLTCESIAGDLFLSAQRPAEIYLGYPANRLADTWYSSD